MSESPLRQNKPLQESDLDALISAAARENRFIDFKSEYLPQTDAGKKKLLQSVAAFANTRGGDLVLGMKETDGAATGLAPLSIDADQCRLQIQDLIRVHLRPPLGGVRIETVGLKAGGYAVIVRVPKSWAGPHMLTYGDDRRFYIRDDGGKRPMDYEEVREGFVAGEATGARLRNFRMERCAAILNDETPRVLTHRARIVVHLLPFEMFAMPRRFDVRHLHDRCRDLETIVPSSSGRAFDIDGCFAASAHDEGKTDAYVHAFCSGAVEAVDAYMLNVRSQVIQGTEVERHVSGAVQRYLSLLTTLELPGPYALFLSLLNVRGYSMSPPNFVLPSYLRKSHPVARDHLYVPEALFESAPQSVSRTLFPVFNSVWNACGWPQSLNYDENGNWNARL